jgi:kynureninase
VELSLHAWDVDFAVWCTYKYLNAGPGAIAGVFVHEKHHGPADPDPSYAALGYRHRLAGWYGADKAVRFNMEKEFRPAEGAHGFQVSNPSAIDLASLSGALSVFNKTRMCQLRDKALVLTAYLEWLLEGLLAGNSDKNGQPAFKIITPGNPLERGSQLSLLLKPGSLDKVSKALQEGGVVCDARKPDVIRVAPVPMYCRFEDVWQFIEVFRKAIQL